MSQTVTKPAETAFNWGEFIRKYLIVGILVGLIILVGALTGGKTLQLQNLLNIIVQVAPIGIMACGMTFVIIALGIDLSVGSIVAVAAVVSASLVQLPDANPKMYPGLLLPAIVGIVAGMAVGTAGGAINGFLIAKFKIAPFIATLGMMTAARGIALLYTETRPVSRLDPNYNFIGQGSLLGIPVPIIIFLAVAIATHVLLNYTRFGRHTYAIGGNEQAAKVSGINVAMVKFRIYTLSGFFAGIAGMILAARVGSGNPALGTGIELDAITATVIGGTSFAGGIGTAWGTVVGALIIGVINNGMDLMGVQPYMQLIVKGIIIVVAIIIDERKNR